MLDFVLCFFNRRIENVPNLGCNCTFPIDLAPNGIVFFNHRYRRIETIAFFLTIYFSTVGFLTVGFLTIGFLTIGFFIRHIETVLFLQQLVS